MALIEMLFVTAFFATVCVLMPHKYLNWFKVNDFQIIQEILDGQKNKLFASQQFIPTILMVMEKNISKHNRRYVVF